MPKNSNSFRLRFQYYKLTGKLPYKAGRIDDEQMYRERMKDVARENYEQWGYNSPADAWQDAVNDPTYDYRGYYSDPEFQNVNANSLTHWPDRYKTPLHPTFSSESKYHGKQSEKNPYGLRGGQWVGDKFIPATWQNPIRIPHYAGGRDGEGEEQTDALAVRNRLVPLEVLERWSPAFALKRLAALEEANARNLAAIIALNQTLIGTAQHVPQQLLEYYADKEDTRKFMERKRTGEELADKIFGTAFDVATLYVPAARVGWNMMKGAAGALKSGVRAAARGTKNAAETLRYGTLGKPRVSKDYTDLVIPNIQELSLYLKPSSKQTRIIKEDTYPTYIGPKHSVSEVVNADGTVNPRAAMRILHEVADNIPGAYRMENRLENPVWHLNDPTTYHHTREVARRAWGMDIPSGYTKQDLMIAALGHDFGKIVTGDGHAKIGADLLRQIFPDITDLQLLAIREHMGQNLTTPLSVATKRADNIVENWRPTVPYTPKISPATINLTKPENSIINSLFEDASIPYEELQMFKNSVLERMADARGITDPVLRKNFILDGMSKVGTKYNRSSILSNPLAEGTTDTTTGTITIKPGSEEFALGHEMRHRLDYVRHWNGSENFTLTPEEYGTLRKAYTAEFLDYPAEYPMQVEMVTTNADVRKQLLGKLALRDLSVAEQNAKIDAATGTEVLNALKNANDYGNYYYRALMTNPIYRKNNAQLMINILRNIKAAMKYVGAFGVPTALSVPLLNNTNNEK